MLKITALFVFLFVITIQAQVNVTSVHSLGFKGPVRQVIITGFVADSSDGFVVPRVQLEDAVSMYDNIADVSGVLRFNSEGLLVRHEFRNAEGEILNVSNYGHDQDGRLQWENYTDAGANEISRVEYTYDTDGKLIKEYSTIYGHLDRDIRYTYDEKGRMVRKERFYLEEELTSRIAWKYDSKNRIVEYVQYDPRGEILKFERNEYDGDGNLVKKIFPRPDQTIQMYVQMEYDERNNLISEIFFNGDEVCNYMKIYEWNDSGDLTREADCLCDGTANKDQRFIYEYDGMGNWTSKKVVAGGVCAIIVTAEISYFSEEGERP